MADTFIRVDPSIHFGAPRVGGTAVETVAGMVWAGDRVDAVAEEYNLSAAQVLVACWYAASHGLYRMRWRAWLRGCEEMFWHCQYDKIPDPPSFRDQPAQQADGS